VPVLDGGFICKNQYTVHSFTPPLSSSSFVPLFPELAVLERGPSWYVASFSGGSRTPYLGRDSSEERGSRRVR